MEETRVEELLVAVQLVPGGHVVTVRLQAGEQHLVLLPSPVLSHEGLQYTAVAITIDRI